MDFSAIVYTGRVTNWRVKTSFMSRYLGTLTLRWGIGLRTYECGLRLLVTFVNIVLEIKWKTKNTTSSEQIQNPTDKPSKQNPTDKPSKQNQTDKPSKQNRYPFLHYIFQLWYFKVHWIYNSRNASCALNLKSTFIYACIYLRES
jgi:hypothetical protein